MQKPGALPRSHWLDLLVGVAAVVAAVEVVLRDDARATPLGFAAPAAALIALPLLGRRRFPFAAPVTLWLLAAAVSFLDGELVVSAASTYVAGLAASALLGNLGDPLQARSGLVVLVGASAIITYNNPDHAPGDFLFTPLGFALAWLAGFALRQRAAEAAAAERRAEQAERRREATARVAVAEERARIARELHDIVAHAVSVMVRQVGAVRLGMPATMEQDRDALSAQRAGRAALAEMRRLLGAMRDDDRQVELAPQPSLEAVDALVERVRLPGLPVRLHAESRPNVSATPAASATTRTSAPLDPGRFYRRGVVNTMK